MPKRIRGTAQKRANSHGAGGMGDEDAREPQPLPVLLVADETPLTAGRETFEEASR